MHTETLLAFMSTALLLAFVPGPDNIFVLTQSALRGRRAGLSIVLGLCTGLIVHTTAVALGLAVLLQKSQLSFSLLKYAGAAYLTYLAWHSFRTKPALKQPTIDSADDGRKYYMKGILMNITNPKVSIFFLAFLPQFVDRNAGNPTLQLLALGGIFIIATLMAFSLMAIFAANAGSRFNRSVTAQKVMNRAAGIVFLGLAIKLATTHQ